jgi:hypothetical protein
MSKEQIINKIDFHCTNFQIFKLSNFQIQKLVSNLLQKLIFATDLTPH